MNTIRPFRNIKRRLSREISVGKVRIGGENPISVQSMTNTLTTDIKKTINQVNALYDAGADIVCGDDLVEKVEGGFLDFDRCISTPDMMPKVGKLGKVLGPRNLMPNPKLGSVTNDIAKAVEGAKAGEIEFKNNETLVQAGIAKSNFSKEDLVTNVKFFVEVINKERPSGVKGEFIKKVSISPTMGPGINIDLNSVIN